MRYRVRITHAAGGEPFEFEVEAKTSTDAFTDGRRQFAALHPKLRIVRTSVEPAW